MPISTTIHSNCFRVFVMVILFLVGCVAPKRTSAPNPFPPPPTPADGAGNGSGATGLKQALMRNNWGTATLFGQALDVEDPMAESPSIRFMSSGKLVGNTGCNAFQGTYSMVGDQVKLDPGAMTKKFCEGSKEAKFLEALKRTTQLRLLGSAIELVDDQETVLMQLKPKRD